MEGLYGRADVLARARRGVEHALAGAGRLLLFTGEPGIGKSRLAEQVAAEAAERGAAVAWGRCWEAGGAPAYWPWVQVFRALELEDPFSGTAPQLGQAAEARFAVFDRAVAALKAAASKRPLALVLDDLHAADAPSLLLLLLLARELPRAPILVVGAYRAAEAQAVARHRAAAGADRPRGARCCRSRRLSPEAVATWVREAGRPTRGRAASCTGSPRVTRCSWSRRCGSRPARGAGHARAGPGGGAGRAAAATAGGDAGGAGGGGGAGT